MSPRPMHIEVKPAAVNVEFAEGVTLTFTDPALMAETIHRLTMALTLWDSARAGAIVERATRNLNKQENR